MCTNTLQPSPILYDPMDYGLPDSFVHGILQARTLEWVATPFSRGSSQSRIEPSSPAVPALQVDSLPLSHWGKYLLGINFIWGALG